MANPIVLLSGPVGAGKTTVARELVRLWPGKSLVYIEGDVFWQFHAKSESLGPTYPKFLTVMRGMVAAAVQFAAQAPVIVDFSIPPWFLDAAREIVGDAAPVHYVVLRPTEAVCAQRAATRSSGTIADYSQYRELYRDFDAAGAHIIDDSREANDVARSVLDGVASDAFRLR